MISHKISWWGISVVQVIQVIQVIQLICVMQVRLAHLWPNFRVIFVFLRLFIFFDITMELSKCKKVDFWVCGSMLQHKKDNTIWLSLSSSLSSSLSLLSWDLYGSHSGANNPNPTCYPAIFWYTTWPHSALKILGCRVAWNTHEKYEKSSNSNSVFQDSYQTRIQPASLLFFNTSAAIEEPFPLLSILDLQSLSRDSRAVWSMAAARHPQIKRDRSSEISRSKNWISELKFTEIRMKQSCSFISKSS